MIAQVAAVLAAPGWVHPAETLARVLIGACFLLNGLALWQLVVAARGLAKIDLVSEASVLWSRDAEVLAPIALIVPAYNEELTIVESLRSLLALRYPRLEIIVVNDGSRDATMDVLISAFELSPVRRDHDLLAPCKPLRAVYGNPNQPRMIVVDKENGGKADALNAGINLARSPIVCAMDADSLLERDALLLAVRPFVEHPRETVAVGGTVRVANGCRIEFGQVTRVGVPRNGLALLQTLEYLRAFIMARVAWSRLGALTIISGAFGLFSRQAVLKVGGYSLDTVGEDMELVLKLHKHFARSGRPYSIGFVPEAVCWTEAPESLRVLGRQRARWQRGALETLWRHKDMLFDPHCRLVGVLGLGRILVSDLLEPFVELAGLVIVPLLCLVGLLPLDYLYAQFAVSAGFGAIMSIGALGLEETELHRLPDARSLLLLLGAVAVECLGYRQLNCLWRIRGAAQFFTGAQGWGHMPRKGFAPRQA
jgi:cellulose synthase/poly-beta-1,6-N-acetylglucosamine synthase-like glycosyltransferase